VKNWRKKIHQLQSKKLLNVFKIPQNGLYIDNRQQHKTKPPTRWFIAETDSMRRLKIVFITYPSGDHVIKSAFEPDEYEEKVYESETKI